MFVNGRVSDTMAPMPALVIAHHAIELSNTDKVLFPDDGITKGELIRYYRRVAPQMLPHLKGRMLTLHRFPDGIKKPGFYQRAVADYVPSWIPRHTFRDKGGGRTTSVVGNNAATLVYLANQACVTPHAWLSRVDKLDYPDRLIFDLDPSTNNFALVQKTALALRDVLKELGLVPFVQTTGSRGLHVVVPLDRRTPFDEVRAFAREVSAVLVERNADCCTVEQRKAKRKHRVFIDTLRNSYAQSAVPPYAVRARKGAPVATPLTWREVQDRKLTPQKYTIRTIFRRLVREDPWKRMESSARRLDPARQRLAKMMRTRVVRKRGSESTQGKGADDSGVTHAR